MFIGTGRHQSVGTLTFKSTTGNIVASITYGKTKNKYLFPDRRPQDYFAGAIRRDGKEVCRIYGSYLGFLEFDGVRYWDARDLRPFALLKTAQALPSDSRYRPDLQQLAQGNVEEAQKCKEQMEEAQRKDAKLRAALKKPQKPKKKGWFS